MKIRFRKEVTVLCTKPILKIKRWSLKIGSDSSQDKNVFLKKL